MAAEANRHKQSKAQLEAAKAAASRELQRYVIKERDGSREVVAGVVALWAIDVALRCF
jgi:hypothetical protein